MKPDLFGYSFLQNFYSCKAKHFYSGYYYYLKTIKGIKNLKKTFKSIHHLLS